MSTRLLLEGNNLEDLLARVRVEHGPNARIIKADKVRVGGVAGFFAREKYEISVEIQTETSPEIPPAWSTANGLAGSRHVPSPAVAPMSPSSVTVPMSPSQLQPTYLTDLTERADQLEKNHVENADFAQVLARLHQPGMITTLTEIQSDSELKSVIGIEEETSAQFRPATPASIYSDHQASTMPVMGLSESAARLRPAVPAVDGTPIPEMPTMPASLTMPTVPIHESSNQLIQQQLMELGLPQILAQKVRPGDRYAELVAALSQLPTADELPNRPGEIIAIVGEGKLAYKAAQSLAVKLSLDPADVVLAAAGTVKNAFSVPAAKRLSSPAEAKRKARSLHRLDFATIVAIEVDFVETLSYGGIDWVYEIIDALGSRAVWAVIDATRKIADVRHFVSKIDTVHALVVMGAQATLDPAAVLELGIPIALIDDQRATAAYWASMLCQRWN